MRHSFPSDGRRAIPEYSICLVRERRARFQSRCLNSAEAVYRTLKTAFDRLDRETFIVVTLDAKNFPLGFNIVAVGSLTMTVVHQREVFKLAVLQNAAGVILAHNHPSGVIEQSPEDVAVTKRIVEAGRVLGIAVLDHVIFGRNRYLSFADERLLPDAEK